MDSSSCDELPSPTLLKSLVCDVKDPYGNYLIHRLVLNNSKPSDSCRESDIRAALRSFPAAQVNRRNEDGFTALHLAVMKRNSFMVKMMLSCLPTLDVHAKCFVEFGRTALHLAASTYFFKSPYLNDGNNYGKSRLDVNEDCLEIVKVLVESGASVNECDNVGDTPFHVAARWNRIDVLELLISKGAALNAKNNSGKTPLYKAVNNRCFETVKVLVERGASVNECDKYGETPLHIAATYNRIEILMLLIIKGAALNAEDHMGRTPLHLAARLGHLEAVKVLVERGSAVDAVDKKGNTALKFAEARNHIEIVAYLNSRFANVNAVGRDDGVLVPERVCRNTEKLGEPSFKKMRRN